MSCLGGGSFKRILAFWNHCIGKLASHLQGLQLTYIVFGYKGFVYNEIFIFILIKWLVIFRMVFLFEDDGIVKITSHVRPYGSSKSLEPNVQIDLL